ncbi:MAG: hypothetical protein V3T17_08565 [Pseudomonadales bacterium]
MHHISVNEAEGQLAELVKLASQGEEVAIRCANGSVIKLIVEKPPMVGQPRRFGWYDGQPFTTSEDFDDALPDHFWLGDSE